MTSGGIASDLARQEDVVTERLVVRPLRMSDAGLIAHYTADRRVAEGTRSIPHPLPPGAAEAFVTRAMSPERDEDVWAIDGSENRLAELLGLVSLTRMEAGQSELGFWIGAGFWNTALPPRRSPLWSRPIRIIPARCLPRRFRTIPALRGC